MTKIFQSIVQPGGDEKIRMMIKKIVAPKWGHPIMTPDGKEIRVPHFAFKKLRKMKLLDGNRAKLKSIIYDLLDNQYDDLLQGLARLLGSDLSGPAWLFCNCDECKRKISRIENTMIPGVDGFMRYETDRIVRDVRRKYE